MTRSPHTPPPDLSKPLDRPVRRTANDGRVVLDGVPEIPDWAVAAPRRFQDVRSARPHAFSADGTSIYITTRFGDTQQIHRVDRPLGARHQLTFFPEPVRQASLARRPGSHQLLFSMDEGGNERFQLYLLDIRDGDSRRISDGKSKHGSVVLSTDGSRIAFQSTRRDGRSLDVWAMNPDDPDSAELLVAAPDRSWWAPCAWDRDGRRLLVLQYEKITRCRAHVFDRQSGRLELLAGGEAYHEPVAFGALEGVDGVYLLSDEGSEFRQLVHLGSDGVRRCLTGDLPWNASGFAMAPPSAASPLAGFVLGEEGYGRLFLLDPATGRLERVEGLPDGVVSGLCFSEDGQRLAFALDGPASPADVYCLRFGDSEAGPALERPFQVERWTESEVGGLDRSAFVVPELVRYPTFDHEPNGDRRTIPAFVYLPRRGEPPYPVAVRIHGGPEAQARPTWNGNLQMWVDRLGIAVVVPNVRGSSGYGKTWVRLDDGRLREDSVRDIGALLDWLEKRDELDHTRVAVYGGSYGGYMVLASLVHFSDRLRCGIDVVGISNFVTFLENTHAYRRDLRRAEYGDERDPEMRRFLDSISPNRHAERITAPLFVAQGHNDPRVPPSEAEQIVRDVRGTGQPVWYLDALDEGHGFQKKANRDLFEQAVVYFLSLHLLDARDGLDGRKE